MEIKSDDFRFITSIHTTSRQLFVCSEIIKVLGVGQFPKSIVEEALFNWSKEEEQFNQGYKDSRGKLTENGKKTTALKHYFDLCESLGLVVSFNNIYNNSRLGNVLLNLKNLGDRTGELSIIEINFYLFQLLKADSDGLFLILDLVAEFCEINQKKMQEMFKDKLNVRLLGKQSNAASTVKIVINERYRALNYIWKSAEKYAEHLLIPRCEWLISLGILKQRRDKSSTLYKFTEMGKEFYDNIPMSTDTLKDINEDWLFSNYFSIKNKLDENSIRKDFIHLPNETKQELLGEYLEKTFNSIKNSNSFRFPVYESLLYTCSVMYYEGVIINFKDIIGALEAGINYKKRNYKLKSNGRLNESYIITRLM